MVEAALIGAYAAGFMASAFGFGYVNRREDICAMWTGLAASLVWPLVAVFIVCAATGRWLEERCDD